jgi:hypothetical protein
MDANPAAQRKRMLVVGTFVLAVLGWASAARAGTLVPTPAAVPPGAFSYNGSVYGELPTADEAPGGDAVTRAALLSSILLIPPPVDLIAESSTTQASTTHAVVTAGPVNAVTATTTENGGGTIAHTEGAPEPTSLVLSLIGSGAAAAGLWYRRNRARSAANVGAAVSGAA